MRDARCDLDPGTANASCDAVRSSGFTLIEVTIATSLLVVIALGSAQLFVLAIRHNVAARQQLVMTLAAARKVDDLRRGGRRRAAGAVAARRAGPRRSTGSPTSRSRPGVICVRRWLIVAGAGLWRPGAIGDCRPRQRRRCMATCRS